jgi:hypothetical protein
VDTRGYKWGYTVGALWIALGVLRLIKSVGQILHSHFYSSDILFLALSAVFVVVGVFILKKNRWFFAIGSLLLLLAFWGVSLCSGYNGTADSVLYDLTVRSVVPVALLIGNFVYIKKRWVRTSSNEKP